MKLTAEETRLIQTSVREGDVVVLAQCEISEIFAVVLDSIGERLNQRDIINKYGPDSTSSKNIPTLGKSEMSSATLASSSPVIILRFTALRKSESSYSGLFMSA